MLLTVGLTIVPLTGMIIVISEGVMNKTKTNIRCTLLTTNTIAFVRRQYLLYLLRARRQTERSDIDLELTGPHLIVCTYVSFKEEEQVTL